MFAVVNNISTVPPLTYMGTGRGGKLPQPTQDNLFTAVMIPVFFILHTYHNVCWMIIVGRVMNLYIRVGTAQP